MPETLESARRWSGYVCADCRFVFRVPRDHDGFGVVCPSCRMLLKIPTPADRLPPLVVPMKSVVATSVPTLPEGEPHSDNKHRRRKKSHQSGEPSWDRASKGARQSGRKEKRQMFWMLMGGGTLFALLVAGVVMALKSGEQAVPPIEPQVGVTPEDENAGEHGEFGSMRSDTELLAMAEPLAREFLDATRVEDMIPLVRNPEIAEPRMRAFYPDGKIHAEGLSAFNVKKQVLRVSSLASLDVRTNDYLVKKMAFFESPDAIRIDWESWAGWSAVPWSEFLAEKSSEPRVFRLNLRPVEYYNFEFSDDSKWQSYRLDSPDGKHSVYGYAEKGTVLNARLRPGPDVKKLALVLALKFPENPSSPNQVLVDRLVADGWVLEAEESP